MLEKSFTIKDLIIYLIPGILNLLLLLALIFPYLDLKQRLPYLLENNILLGSLGIVLSFLVGFLLSQFQIIMYKKIFNKKLKKIRELDTIIEINDFKLIISDEVKKIFKLDQILSKDILENNQIFFYCYNFVVQNGNEKSIELINRSNNLSSFATGLFIPILLLIINLINLLSLSWSLKFVIIIILVIVSFIVLHKIILNFKSDFYTNTFRFFYLINNSK